MRKLHVSADLALPVDFMTMATVVYGARGSGKTTFGAVVAEELHAAKQRFCAIDLKGDLWGLKSTADGKGEGIPVVIFGGDHADLPLEEGAGKFLGELVAGLEQSVVLDLEHFSKGKQVRFLAEFFAALYDKNREPLLIIADEAQRYAPQKALSPEGQVCLGAVEDLVKLGRKHGIGVLLLTQRGAGLNKEVSEICDMMVVFRTPGPLDQQRVRDWFEANSGDTALIDAVSGLQKGHALVASAHPDLKVCKVVYMRQRETFDSSATPKVGERRREPKKLAKPQLEVIKAQMTDALQRQEANDPRRLKQEIQALQARLQKGSLAPGYVAVEKGELDALAHAKRKMERALGLTREGLPFGALLDTLIARKSEVKVDPDQLRRVERLVDKLGKETENLDKSRDRLAQAQQAVISETDNLRQALKLQLRTLQAPPEQAAPYLPGGVLKRPKNGVIVHREIEDRGFQPLPKIDNDGDLPRGEAATLAACIQYPEGLTRSQLTVLTGYKRSSRDAYISRLVPRGYVVVQGERIVATPEGRAALPDAQPLPQGEELQRFWLERLPEGERVVLKELLGIYPNGVERTWIDERTGYKRSSRDAYISRLMAKQLVEAPNSGVVKASDVLFN